MWSVRVAFFHAMIEEEMFVRPPKNMRKEKSIWRLESHAWNSGCKFMLAKIGTRKIVPQSVGNSRKFAVCWIQRD